jgi:hypothetical protein
MFRGSQPILKTKKAKNDRQVLMMARDRSKQVLEAAARERFGFGVPTLAIARVETPAIT